jgi:hypothetical protein
VDALLLGASNKAESTIGAIALLVGLLILVIGYFTPTLVALKRKPINMGTVIVLNLFLGWTFVGWVMSLALAFGAKSVRVDVAHHHYGPQQYPMWSPAPPSPPDAPRGIRR